MSAACRCQRPHPTSVLSSATGKLDHIGNEKSASGRQCGRGHWRHAAKPLVAFVAVKGVTGFLAINPLRTSKRPRSPLVGSLTRSAPVNAPVYTNGLLTRTPRISCPSFMSSVYNTAAPVRAAATTTSALQNESFAWLARPTAARIAA